MKKRENSEERRRGNYPSPSVNAPEGEKTGYRERAADAGAAPGEGSGSDSAGRRCPTRCGLALEDPHRGCQGFRALLIISIFMTRLVNKTSELATHIYLSRSRSAKQRLARGLARH